METVCLKGFMGRLDLGFECIRPSTGKYLSKPRCSVGADIVSFKVVIRITMPLSLRTTCDLNPTPQPHFSGSDSMRVNAFPAGSATLQYGIS